MFKYIAKNSSFPPYFVEKRSYMVTWWRIFPWISSGDLSTHQIYLSLQWQIQYRYASQPVCSGVVTTKRRGNPLEYIYCTCYSVDLQFFACCRLPISVTSGLVLDIYLNLILEESVCLFALVFLVILLLGWFSLLWKNSLYSVIGTQ